MVRAVRLDHYGDRDVLYVAEVDMPVAAAGEVVVKVEAAGINPGEAAIRQGFYDAYVPATFPSGQGSDLAGTISAVGKGVSGWSVGDEVLGWSWRRSSQAEFVAVPADQLVAKPAKLSWPEAGSLYVVGATAYAAVRAVGAGPGDTVAVSAAAGGVGVVVVQLLRLKGSEVIGIASPANHNWLSEHGATPVAYGDGLAERIRGIAPGGVDAFIDLFGPQYVELAIELGVSPERIETIISFEAAHERGTKAEGSQEASTREVMTEMADYVASGQIELPIAATYRLDQVKDAYAELEQRHTRGKIVLIP